MVLKKLGTDGLWSTKINLFTLKITTKLKQVYKNIRILRNPGHKIFLVLLHSHAPVLI